MPKKVFIGSDHAGFSLKEKLKEYLKHLRFSVEDVGNQVFDSQDDYPDFALRVAERVSQNPQSRGILICSSGVGMCITANKVKGIRAVNAQSVKIAEKSREHNDTNVLCLGQDYIEEPLAKRIVRAWLKKEFSKKRCHIRRINKIKEIEKEKR